MHTIATIPVNMTAVHDDMENVIIQLIARPVLKDLIADDVATFGHYQAAILRNKKIPFTIFYFLAFGKLPRKLQTQQVSSLKAPKR